MSAAIKLTAEQRIDVLDELRNTYGLDGDVEALLDSTLAALRDRGFDVSPDPVVAQIASEVQIMLGSATELYDGTGFIAGYQIKTGALHRILGHLAGAGHPVYLSAKSQSASITAIRGDSSIRLREGDGSVLATHIDQRVSVPAARANEVAPVLVNLGLNSPEHDSESAASARPHGCAPVDGGNRSAKAEGGAA